MTPHIRTSVPAPLPPLPFNIPSAHRETLSNGLKLVVFEDKRLPIVSFRLAFFSGDANDLSESIGLTSAMASMLNEGTAKYNSRELAEKIERFGANLSARASDDFTIISASALSLYSSDILDLMEEVVLRPQFPENELDLYRRNTVEHLKFQRSQPNFLANEQTARLLYGEHPYSRVSPSAQDVEKLSRDEMIAFHQERFIPNNAILIAVGDTERDELLKEIDSRFGDWQPGEPPKPDFPPLPQRSRRTLTVVDRPGSAQANIVLSNLAIDRTHPDYFRFLVMNQVLGAGASSRIFMNLREEKGYTYGAYTRFDARRFAGDFEATAEVRTAVTGDSLKEFFYELDRIREAPVAEQELEDARNFLTGVFPIRAETQEGLTNLLVNQYLYDLPEDYLQTYRDRVSEITVQDVKTAAEKYVRPGEMSIVIVGDADDVLPQAREYADEVEIFDTEGNGRDPASYSGKATTTATVGGKWSLTIDFQGQSLPVSLTLLQKDGALTGSLETMLGNGEITEGSIRGNKLNASVRTEIQGEPVDLTITGKVDGDTVAGTLSAPISPEPLTFSGKRAG